MPTVIALFPLAYSSLQLPAVRAMAMPTSTVARRVLMVISGGPPLRASHACGHLWTGLARLSFLRMDNGVPT